MDKKRVIRVCKVYMRRQVAIQTGHNVVDGENLPEDLSRSSLR